jgi:hypothetical protein
VFLLWAWNFFVVVGKFDFNGHNQNGLEISIVTIIPLCNYVNKGQAFMTNIPHELCAKK